MEYYAAMRRKEFALPSPGAGRTSLITGWGDEPARGSALASTGQRSSESKQQTLRVGQRCPCRDARDRRQSKGSWPLSAMVAGRLARLGAPEGNGGCPRCCFVLFIRVVSLTVVSTRYRLMCGKIFFLSE